MTHPLTLNWRGPGTPAVVRMVNGTTQDTTGLGTLPGAVVDTVNGSTQTEHAINRVVQLGHRIFAAVGTDIYKKEGAGAFAAEGQAAALSAAGLNQTDRGPMQAYIDPVTGPGWFQLFRGTSSRFHVIKYAFLTDSYTVTDLVVSGTSFPQILNHVMNGDEFIGTAERGLVFYNPVTDVLTTTASTGATGASYGLTAAKGVTYACGPDSNINDDTVKVFAILGNTFAVVADLPLTTVRFGTVGADPYTGQTLIYEKDGNLRIAAPRNDTPADSPNGWRLFEYNTTTSVVTDITDTVLHPLLRRDGGLAGTGGSGSSRDQAWRFHHYKVIENPFGAERIFIKVTLGCLNEGSVLFEDTAGGWALIGSTQWPGFLVPVHNPFGDSSFFWTNGELSALFTAKVTPVSGGVRLDFRCYGDPGNADKVVRVYYSDAPGAPIQQAQLSSPVGGTGGSSVLVGDDLTAVDANGESGGPTTYSVVHDTLAQGIAASADVRWFVEVNVA